MIFAIDVGNTHIVLGCLENGKIIHTARLTTDRNKTDSEYAVSIGSILRFAGIDFKSFDGAIISSVVPQVTDSLRLALKLLLGIEPQASKRALIYLSTIPHSSEATLQSAQLRLSTNMKLRSSCSTWALPLRFRWSDIIIPSSAA